MRRRRDIVLEQPGQPILRLWKDGEVRQGQDNLRANGNNSNVLVPAGRKAF